MPDILKKQFLLSFFFLLLSQSVSSQSFKAFEKGIQGTRYTDQCAGQPQEVMIKAEWQRGWDAFIGSDFYKF